MGRQRRATGGLGTASGPSRGALMYVCRPTECPYNAFSHMLPTDMESSLQGVSCGNRNTAELFTVLKGKKTVDTNIIVLLTLFCNVILSNLRAAFTIRAH